VSATPEQLEQANEILAQQLASTGQVTLDEAKLIAADILKESETLIAARRTISGQMEDATPPDPPRSADSA
jgi:hypothetical protein